MRQNYSNNNEPELDPKDWLRYVFLAVGVDFLVAILLAVRMAQAMLDSSFDWLREAVPPIIDLFFLGLLIILSMKTLTIWRKSETHPKRRDIRTMALILLGSIWFMFILTMYIAPILSLLGVTALARAGV